MCSHLDLLTVVAVVARFGLDIKTFCLYVIWENQDQIWAKSFCIPKTRRPHTPILEDIMVNGLFFCATLTNDPVMHRLSLGLILLACAKSFKR